MTPRVRKAFMTVLLGALTGCASAGAFPSVHLTTVELSEANYRTIATNLSGEASAEYILGISGGSGSGGGTLALARIKGEGQLYGAALSELWQTFEDQYGAVEGRSLALVNVRFDSDAVDLILYTKLTVWVRADVVEFGG